jgi:acyl carrier protein
MTSDEIRQAFLDALADIAPEGDYARLKPDLPLRDQLDIDSYDFLNVVVALHERIGVDVPEADYQKLATLDSAVSYLAARLGASTTSQRAR